MVNFRRTRTLDEAPFRLAVGGPLVDEAAVTFSTMDEALMARQRSHQKEKAMRALRFFPSHPGAVGPLGGASAVDKAIFLPCRWARRFRPGNLSTAERR